MDIELASGVASAVETDLLVVGAFSDAPLPASTRTIDQASNGHVSNVVTRGDLDTDAGATVVLFDVPGTTAKRVLVVSLGKRASFGDAAYRKAIRAVAGALTKTPARVAAVALADVEVPGRPLTWRIQEVALGLADGAYKFTPPGKGTNGSNGGDKKRGVDTVTILVDGPIDTARKGALTQGLAVAEGMALARELGNLPGNVCTPSYLADTARELARQFPLDVEILERADMEKLGMGSALSVGRASSQPCKFIVMQHRGGGGKPVVLVGKGVTFDTGGISLKPGADLDEMKFDMCGAAAVFGAMKTAARLKLPMHLVGIVPAVENMPGGDATRPGDVVRSMSGLTIEVLNTDAEGRLILCDALTYAERFNPEYVIDVATLTGACVIALGNVATGLFANDDALANDLIACGSDTGDRAWRLPLWDDYLEQLRSNFADMSNLGGKPAGAVTAACFLGRFSKNMRWAHLDIAGTSSVSGASKGATGRPVRLLTEYLTRHAELRLRPKSSVHGAVTQ